MLALPFVALIIYFRKYSFEWKTFGYTVVITGFVFFLIHNVIIKGMPKIADAIGIEGTAILIISVFIFMVWAIKNQKKLLSISLTSMILVLIGYSTYALIFIRSNQNPGIDENDPETVEAFISYLEREQYGDVGVLPRRFKGISPIHEVVGYPEGKNREFSSSQESKYKKHESGKQWSYFWNYQIRKMYNRYFLWQFAGKGKSEDPFVANVGASSNEDGVDWRQFGLPIAFIMGLIGMLFLAGMLSSIYSSMQSTLIYQNSIDDLRSPTLSLMTLFIGTGIIGALNVSWMGLHMTVSNVITVMALEGFAVFLLTILLLRYLNNND
mgnify:CR=1 FL=1